MTGSAAARCLPCCRPDGLEGEWGSHPEHLMSLPGRYRRNLASWRRGAALPWPSCHERGQPASVTRFKDAYRWAQNAVAGRIGDSRELDDINEALRVASLAFHPVLAQQLEQDRALATALAERDASLAAEVLHGEELAAELRDVRSLIANVVDSFGQASQGLEHAIRLAGEARADLAYQLSETTARASGLEENRVLMAREIATAAAHAAHAANRIAGFDATCA